MVYLKVTREQIEAMCPKADDDGLGAFLDHAGLLDQAGITKNTVRLVSFLANIATESNFKLVEENLNYSPKRLLQIFPKYFNIGNVSKYAYRKQAIANRAYANRMGNGDERSGDGWKYRGRGWPQLTGKDGYRIVGQMCGLDLVTHPEYACDPRYALQVAIGFWKWKQMDKLADANKPTAVRTRWNGGTNGMAEFKKFYAKGMQVWDGALPPPKQTDPIVYGVQERLSELNYALGKIDGKMGDKTEAAILAFRNDNGLPLSKKIDTALIEALKIAGPRPVSEDRASITAADLSGAGGSQVINENNKAKNLLKGSTVLGVLGALVENGEQKVVALGDYVSMGQQVKSAFDGIRSLGSWLMEVWYIPVVAVPLIGVYWLWSSNNARARDAATGVNLGK